MILVLVIFLLLLFPEIFTGEKGLNLGTNFGCKLVSVFSSACEIAPESLMDWKWECCFSNVWIVLKSMNHLLKNQLAV